MAIYSEISHKKWWFSTLILFFKRVISIKSPWKPPFFYGFPMVVGWSTTASFAKTRRPGPSLVVTSPRDERRRAEDKPGFSARDVNVLGGISWNFRLCAFCSSLFCSCRVPSALASAAERSSQLVALKQIKAQQILLEAECFKQMYRFQSRWINVPSSNLFRIVSDRGSWGLAKGMAVCWPTADGHFARIHDVEHVTAAKQVKVQQQEKPLQFGCYKGDGIVAWGYHSPFAIEDGNFWTREVPIKHDRSSSPVQKRYLHLSLGYRWFVTRGPPGQRSVKLTHVTIDRTDISDEISPERL